MDRKKIQDELLEWASSELSFNKLLPHDLKSLLDSKNGPAMLKMFKLIIERVVSKETGKVISSHSKMEEYNKRTQELLSKGERLAREVAELCEEVNELNGSLEHLDEAHRTARLNEAFRSSLSNQMESITTEPLDALKLDPIIAFLNTCAEECTQVDARLQVEDIEKMVLAKCSELCDGTENHEAVHDEIEELKREINFALEDLLEIDLSQAADLLKSKLISIEEKEVPIPQKSSHGAGEKVNESQVALDRLKSNEQEIEQLLSQVDELKHSYITSRGQQARKWTPKLQQGVEMIIKMDKK